MGCPGKWKEGLKAAVPWWFYFAPYPYGCGCQNRFGIPFWLVGEFTTHFRTYFNGDWDVRWGTGF